MAAPMRETLRPRQRRHSAAAQPAHGALPVLSASTALGPDREDVAARSRRASVHAVLLTPGRRPGGGGAEAEQLPTWWLFVITLCESELGHRLTSHLLMELMCRPPCADCVPLALTNGLFTGIILPPLLQEIVNTTSTYDPSSHETKQSAMGAVSTLISFINLSVPLLGWLAGARAGRL